MAVEPARAVASICRFAIILVTGESAAFSPYSGVALTARFPNIIWEKRITRRREEFLVVAVAASLAIVEGRLAHTPDQR